MKRIILLNLLTVFSLSLNIAQNATIVGVTLDAKTMEPLAGVHVFLNGTHNGGFSDENGNFTIEAIMEGEYTAILSFIGYGKIKVENIKVGKGASIDLGQILMKEEAFSLNQITVTPGSFSIMGDSKLSNQTLTAKNIKNMSWAEDITRAVARLPGISSSDYSSKFAIRGGEADEVLITLDGMELYEPFHQRDYSGGLFSIVDIEAIQGVELMTGGFAAEHGNRLSGAFNMKTKHIGDNQRHTSIGLSTMNARIYTDGKFAKNSGSYIFSARRGMLDVALKAIGNDEVFPKFYDGMTKVEYALNDKHIMSFHVLHSGDKTDINNSPDGDAIEQFSTKYNNTYSWLTLKSFYSPILFSRTLLYAGNINHERSGELDKYENSDKGTFSLVDKRNYNLIGIKQDWDWQLSNKFYLKSGFEAKQINSDYNYTNSINELRVDSNEVIYDFIRDIDTHIKPSGQQVALYVSGRFKILDRLLAETGLRYDYTSYTSDKNISPRVSLAYAFSKNTFLRGAWGYYYQSQFINNLDVANVNGEFNPAKLAKHYVLGFEHLFKNGISLRTEAYYKDLTNISPLWQNLRDHLEAFPEARNDLARVVFNGITSKGIELFLKYDNGGKISWWFSYSLAQANDDINDIEYNGLLIKKTGKLPRLNDQRHTVYADLNYRPNGKWHFNFSWNFYQGWPRTDYTYRYQTLPNGDLHFYAVHSEYNGKQYPAYHRLDVRANRQFKLEHGSITAFLHLVNVYNRQNLKKFDLDTRNDAEELSLDENGNYIPFEDNKYWLGLTPVMGAAWEF